MIGIYKIKNILENKEYIGASTDIKRRFAEHKTPKARGNERLHKDMKRLGIENFEFSILCKCEKEELFSKELYYIKKLNPFYNYIGKNRSKEEKEKISKGTKKWWNSLDSKTKEKIIKNNLVGRRKGYKLSEETKNKLRKWVSENQGIKVTIVETGQTFKSIKECEKFLNACDGTVNAYWKGKIKSVKGYNVVKCRD